MNSFQFGKRVCLNILTDKSYGRSWFTGTQVTLLCPIQWYVAKQSGLSTVRLPDSGPDPGPTHTTSLRAYSHDPHITPIHIHLKLTKRQRQR